MPFYNMAEIKTCLEFKAKLVENRIELVKVKGKLERSLIGGLKSMKLVFAFRTENLFDKLNCLTARIWNRQRQKIRLATKQSLERIVCLQALPLLVLRLSIWHWYGRP